MSRKLEEKLVELDSLQARYAALRDRVAAGCDVTGVPPGDASIATFLEARTIVESEISTLAQLHKKIAAGNGFLSGFTLWMSRHNVNRLEGLINKAETQCRAAIAARENETQ